MIRSLILIFILFFSFTFLFAQQTNDANKGFPKGTSSYQKNDSSTCPKCEKNIPNNAVFCPYCQNKIKSSIKKTSNQDEEKKYPELKNVELSLFYGLIGGTKSPTIGLTTEGKEIKINTGGNTEIGIGMNILLNPYMKLTSSFGYSWGNLNYKLNNGSGGLSKLPLRMGLLFQLILGRLFDSLYYLTFGPGVSIYFNPNLYYKFSDIDYSVSIKYNTSFGFNGGIGLTFYDMSLKWLFGYIDFRYHNVNYSMKEGDQNGIRLVPGNTKPEWREMDGTHYGLYLGIGVLF